MHKPESYQLMCTCMHLMLCWTVFPSFWSLSTSSHLLPLHSTHTMAPTTGSDDMLTKCFLQAMSNFA
jgi:hypothetical protein